MLIGMTGGLGCGKTTVLRMFGELGCPTLSSDAVVERLLKSSPMRGKIVGLFGPEVLGPDGFISKPALASRVFASEGDLRKLEEILHPRVFDAIQQFKREHAGRVAVVEVPLLFEKQLQSVFAKTVCVVCSEETALQRYTLSRSVFSAEARRRMDLQLPIAEKKRRADFCIDTEQDLDVVKRQVEVLYRRFCLLPQK